MALHSYCLLPNHFHLLIERPYGAVPVAREAHLLEVFRYLSLNPVRAKLCDGPEDWRWSSYAAAVGLAEPASFMTLGLIRSLFGSAGLREFVEVA